MSSALRVLVIDDDDGVRKVLESALEEDEGSRGDGTDWEVKTQGFDRVKRALARFRPDMVVLDLVEGKIPDDRNSGDRSFERIRDNWFCPVVVYTDFADRWIIELKCIPKLSWWRREWTRRKRCWPSSGISCRWPA